MTARHKSMVIKEKLKNKQSPGDVMDNMVIIDNNTVAYI